MGYSARYHAVSLVAVFIALAIGILIGAEFGGDTLTSTRRNLEESLVENLQDARDRNDELSGELNRADEFAERVFPALVRDQLDGRRIGLVALGELPDGVSDSVEEALAPTGARLVGVGVVREPIDVQGLASDLSRTRFADIARDQDSQSAFGVGIGRQLVVGGTLLDRVRGHLFSRASGEFGALDGVIVVRNRPEEMGPKRSAVADQVESGLIEGLVATRAPAVGVEEGDSEDSSTSFFHGNDLTTVDDVDLASGRLATVYALLGAEGSFGVKSSADQLLPDLIVPPAGAPRRPGSAGAAVAPAQPARK